MRQVFLKKDGTERLLLFFAGWGMDERPFLDLNPSCDFMVCFDYLSMDFDAGLVRGYDRIDVVAWSMGVFAASRLDVLDRLAVFSSTAFNGTLYYIITLRRIKNNRSLNDKNRADAYFLHRLC